MQQETIIVTMHHETNHHNPTEGRAQWTTKWMVQEENKIRRKEEEVKKDNVRIIKKYAGCKRKRISER